MLIGKCQHFGVSKQNTQYDCSILELDYSKGGMDLMEFLKLVKNTVALHIICSFQINIPLRNQLFSLFPKYQDTW